jgi:hypothetical protein
LNDGDSNGDGGESEVFARKKSVGLSEELVMVMVMVMNDER